MNPNYENLVNSLIKDGYLKTPEIIEAFKTIDRVNFVREEDKENTYVNAPLPIGFDQTISQPLTVAFMLELLEPKKGEKILDVGAGSGWTSTLLAQIVSETGKVIALELIPELCEFGKKNVSNYNFVKKGILNFLCADGYKGFEEEMPFDKILVSAAASEIPPALKKQLKIGGRIVVPIGQSIFVIEKHEKDQFTEKEYFGFSFVPLVKGK
ncbi:MAG: protein-L-isoaspartate O-methyltransferase [Candidatus Paceibacterota bacterium]|jgi:protein-L-isoaspartate(D-aspartate) O-methyltransferase